MRSLNNAQEEAARYTSGPLLIIAGAGTGKTTVITEKIVSLIESGKAKPEEILALTFTDKAAAEMQERVDARLDTGYADLQISTFHAFCQRLLEEYGLHIGLPNRFKLMTDTDAWMLIREHLFALPLNYYRPLGNPSRHIEELLRHFSKCKDELISPDEYVKHAESVAMDNDETGEMEKNRLTELANVYHAYQQLLLEHNALDFGDLIAYSIRLLHERPSILTQLQARYRFVLVDEFQDVNWAQYQLVRLIAGLQQSDFRLQPSDQIEVRSPKSEVHLTVVGDDDQAIYAFRGASVSNILRFKEDFPNAKETVLTENYRSGQEILDRAYALIQHNNPDRLESKLAINKKLIAEVRSLKSEVQHLHCATLDDEVRAVVERIGEIKSKTQDASWDDFAILVRANAHAEPFLHALELRQIPYEFLSSSGLFRQPIVLDCMSFFTAVSDRLDSPALYRMLRMPCAAMSENDVQKVLHYAKKSSVSYYEVMKRASEFHVSPAGIQEAAKLIATLHEGVRQARGEKPTAVLYAFLEATGYLAYLTHEEGQGNAKAARAIHHLKQFFDFLARFEEAVPGASVAGFVQHMENLLDAGNEGKLYQPSDTPDSVNVMTIHGAKGLEFRYVFVVNMVEDRFPTRRRSEAIEIPAELIKEKLPEGDYHVEEERRLLYVAMTRAKEQLYLTSADDYGGARAKKASRFLMEMGFAQTSKQANKRVNIAEVRSPKSEVHADPHGFAYELPATFSFSQIKAYETCPYQYKLAHLLRIPTRGSASFSFGKTIHATLQHFYERVQELNAAEQGSLFESGLQQSDFSNQPTVDRSPKSESRSPVRVPSLEELLKLYEGCWIGDWYESKEQRQSYEKKGREILKVFYAAEEGKWTVPTALETGFKVKIGDVVLRGQMDRVDQLPDSSLEIVDYKTGKSKEKLASEDKEQLLIYQIAVESLPQYRNIGPPGKLTFFYVNDNVKVSFLGGNKELEKLKEKIMATVSAIRGGDFAATPSSHVCGHCDFRDICEFRVL